MKLKSSSWFAASYAAAMISPAFAIEAPADNAPPPPQAVSQLPEFKLPADAGHASSAPSARSVPASEKPAFFGVVSAQVPGCLADHIGLKEGEGIIIRSVVPEGPAAKAGLVVNDVITRVSDKPVGNAEDFSSQIAAHKPGDTIAIQFIHEGKPASADITLGSRPDGLAFNDPESALLNLENLPKELADRIQKELHGKLGSIPLKLPDDEAALPPQIEEAMRQLQKRMEGAISNSDLQTPGSSFESTTRSSATFQMKDDEGSVEVKSTDGSKQVTLLDRDGKLVWQGPWNSEQDKNAAPPEVRTRMEGLNLDSDFKGHGLRLQFKSKPAGTAAADH